MVKRRISVRNLQAEMVRLRLTSADIAKVIKKSRRTASDKIRGKYAFSLPEALKIRGTFFPGMQLEYLFEADPHPDQKTA